MPRKQNPLIREFILQNVADHPDTVATLTKDAFSISRTTVSNYLNNLIYEGLLRSEGNTSGRSYSLKPIVEKKFSRESNGRWTEDNVWREDIMPLLASVKESIVTILQYGVTEMVNNVLEHSRSPHLDVEYIQTYDGIKINVYDRGIGIFQKITDDFHLEDARTALLELSKGKLTSDKRNHSGEGIYYSSRMFNSFSIVSGKLVYTRTRHDQDDWLIESHDKEIEFKGTFVSMYIRFRSDWTLRGVFDKYQGENLYFRKTHIPIALGRYPGEQLVSRSQARRILARIATFSEVMLDFSNVPDIGQAFADEIFRVFKNANPKTELFAFNTNKNVQKMIEYVQSEGSTLPLPFR